MLRLTLLPLPLIFIAGFCFLMLETAGLVPQMRWLAFVLLCSIPVFAVLEIAAFLCDIVMSHGKIFGLAHWARLSLHVVGTLLAAAIILATLRFLTKGIPIRM